MKDKSGYWADNYQQNRGLSSIVIRKLAEAAKGNGIVGFTAYTSKDNERMINLFHSLDYELKIKGEGDMVSLEALSKDAERVSK